MDKLNIQMLRSSSSGNCTTIWTKKSKIMIDAGIPAHIIKTHLAEYPGLADALLITHAHGDHLSNAACNLFLKSSVPIYMSDEHVLGALKQSLPALKQGFMGVSLFEGKPFKVKDFSIYPFELKHDSLGGCHGFNLFHGNKKITYATDFVETSDELLDRFVDSDVIIIESNHDPDLLWASARPHSTKKRIAEYAHLSNEKCARFLVKVIKESGHLPEAIFLAHISSECNNRSLAEKVTKDIFKNAGIKGVDVLLTYSNKESEKVVI